MLTPVDPETLQKRLNAINDLQKALDNYGEIFQYSFSPEQMKFQTNLINDIAPMFWTVYKRFPTEFPYVLIGILHGFIEEQISAVMEVVIKKN